MSASRFEGCKTDGERLAVLCSLHEDMHTKLFGNGQPGVVAELEKRVKFLEQWLWRGVGACAIAGLLFETFRH